MWAVLARLAMEQLGDQRGSMSVRQLVSSRMFRSESSANMVAEAMVCIRRRLPELCCGWQAGALINQDRRRIPDKIPGT